ncbi:MAG: 4Fe-4S binding protein [Hadesarchaea archaeon]|nr:4Fe-4S binding protein [Hadesarchaea archaeon]
MVSLAVEICGLKFRNPILTAAGPTTRDANSLLAAVEGGAGGLVAKTVSGASEKNPRPNLAKIKDNILSADLWSEDPLSKWTGEWYPKVKKGTDIPLVASIGFTAEEVGELAPKVVAAGVDAVELTIHSPADNPAPIVEAVKTVKEEVDVPVLVKLGPVPKVKRFAEAAEGAGADGIVATGSLGPCLSIDVETAMPLMGAAGGHGWLSGPAVKPLAVRCVADIALAVNVPVIGAGGVSTGRDAVEFIMAGASAVQVCSAAIIHGAGIYGRIADEMSHFMQIKNYRTVEDMRGIALKHLPEAPMHPKARAPEVIRSRCTGCRLCEKSCIFGAVKIIGGVARVDLTRCTGCGLCVSVCPTRALRF